MNANLEIDKRERMLQSQDEAWRARLLLRRIGAVIMKSLLKMISSSMAGNNWIMMWCILMDISIFSCQI